MILRDGLRTRSWFGRFMHLLTTSRSTVCFVCLALLAVCYFTLSYVFAGRARLESPSSVTPMLVASMTTPCALSAASQTRGPAAEWSADECSREPVASSRASTASSSTSSSSRGEDSQSGVFTLDERRHTYPGSQMFADDHTLYPPGKRPCQFIKEKPCECNPLWAVIATGNGIIPDTIDTQLARMKGWCTVVVGDQDTPPNYYRSNARMVYLSPKDQSLPPLSKFRTTHLLPWNHITRKNIGYLYAIMHGATTIFDTDASVKLDPVPSTNHYHIPTSIPPAQVAQAWDCKPADSRSLAPDSVATRVMNTHPLFGQPQSWPRGYPITAVGASLDDFSKFSCVSELNSPTPKEFGASSRHHMVSWDVVAGPSTSPFPIDESTSPSHVILKSRCSHSRSQQTRTRPFPKIGIIQGLINEYPDVDAIYTATAPETAPTRFVTHHSGSTSFGQRGYSAVVPPPEVYVPVNARGTVITEEALWSLILPSTIPPHVADIWRGYITQKIFQYADLTVAVHEPFLRRSMANFNSARRQLNGESHILLRTEALIDFLSKWKPGARHPHINRQGSQGAAKRDANAEGASQNDAPPSWFSRLFSGDWFGSAEESATSVEDAWTLLQRWQSPSLSIPAVLEELYMELAERGLLGSKDIQLAQAWLEDLLSLGYQFPELCGIEHSLESKGGMHRSRADSQAEPIVGGVFLVADDSHTDKAVSTPDGLQSLLRTYMTSLGHSIREALKLTVPKKNPVYVLLQATSPLVTNPQLRSSFIARLNATTPNNWLVTRESTNASLLDRVTFVAVHSHNLLHLVYSTAELSDTTYWQNIFPVYWLPRLANLVQVDASLIVRVPISESVCIALRTPLPQEDVFSYIARSGADVSLVLDRSSFPALQGDPSEYYDVKFPETLSRELTQYDTKHVKQSSHVDPLLSDGLPLSGGLAEFVTSKVFTREYFDTYLNSIKAASHLAVSPDAASDTRPWTSTAVKSAWVRRSVPTRQLSLSPDRLKVTYGPCLNSPVY